MSPTPSSYHLCALRLRVQPRHCPGSDSLPLNWHDYLVRSYNLAGQPHGSGKMEMLHGESYEGDYKDGVIHGKGKYTYQDGDTYDGLWVDGQKSGRGLATYDDGSTYQGLFVADDKHGFGEYTYANGNSYKGGWQNGEQEGRGEYRWKDGTTFTGTYLQGQKHGMGLYEDPTNGESYTGEYKHSKKHGCVTAAAAAAASSRLLFAPLCARECAADGSRSWPLCCCDHACVCALQAGDLHLREREYLQRQLA